MRFDGLRPSGSCQLDSPPLATVVIPTRDRAARVAEAVASVLSQTFGDFELLVIDDAGNDSTAKTVRCVADRRIRLIRHALPKGASAARNTGIQAARGHCVAFLDDDDVWAPTALATQLCAIDGYVATVCAARRRSGATVRPFRGREVTLDYLRRGYRLGGGTSAIVALTAIAREEGFDEQLPCGQDWDFLIRLARRGRVRYVPDALVLYDDRPHFGITTSAANLSWISLERRTLVWRKHRQLLGERLYRLHCARSYLAYLLHRDHKTRHLLAVAASFGIPAVTRVLLEKMIRSAARLVRVRRRLRRSMGLRRGRLTSCPPPRP